MTHQEYGQSFTAEESAAFKAIEQKLADAKREHERRLMAELFADGQCAHYPPAPPRSRLRVWRHRIRGYLVTLWDALRGRDLVERDDYD